VEYLCLSSAFGVCARADGCVEKLLQIRHNYCVRCLEVFFVRVSCIERQRHWDVPCRHFPLEIKMTQLRKRHSLFPPLRMPEVCFGQSLTWRRKKADSTSSRRGFYFIGTLETISVYECYRQRQEFCLFSKTPRPAVGPTLSFLKWVPR
jgi:hypothetical protein